MSATDLALPDDVAVLDAAGDPGAFVVAALDRAKAWLAQASVTTLPEVVETKARAEAIRCYVAQKELGHDAELSATEIVRRAERRIGELIRQGQDDGTIRKRGDGGGDPRFVDPLLAEKKMSPTDFLPSGGGAQANVYDMTDNVSPEDFDEAIEAAKAEDNLSRANVVRKIKTKKREKVIGGTAGARPRSERVEQITALATEGMTSRQIAERIGMTFTAMRDICREEGIEIPADAVVGKAKRIDADRLVGQLVADADALTVGVNLIDYAALDRDQLTDWVSSLSASIRSLTTVKNNLNKELTRDQ